MFAAVLKEARGYFDRRALLSVFFPSLVFWSASLLVVAVADHRLAHALQRWGHQPAAVQAALVVGYLAAIAFWSLLWQSTSGPLDQLLDGNRIPAGPLRALAARAARRHERARQRMVERDRELEKAELTVSTEADSFPKDATKVNPATDLWSPQRVDTELTALEQAVQGQADLTGSSARTSDLVAQLHAQPAGTDSDWQSRHARFNAAAPLLGERLQAAQTKVTEERSVLYQELFLHYPQPPGEVLATRRGNVIKAAEEYPRQRYGLDPIVVWPRLLPLLPAEFAEEVRAAKAAVDLLSNVALYLLGFGLPVLTWLAFHLPRTLGHPTGVLQHLGLAALLDAAVLLLARTAHRNAVLATVGYTEKLRTAFDLHRWRLWEGLRLRAPESLEEERKEWRALNTFLYRGGTPANGELTYREPS